MFFFPILNLLVMAKQPPPVNSRNFIHTAAVTGTRHCHLITIPNFINSNATTVGKKTWVNNIIDTA
jgi:hypothetical protein